MALGGGVFTTQNKVLPGSYINFVSAARASAALSERGVAAVPLLLDWGPTSTVFSVTNEEFQKDSLKIFGYDYGDDKLRPLRELFRHIRLGRFFRLNSGGQRATSVYATAKYPGTRGNDITIVIENSAGGPGLFDVSTVMAGRVVDEQNVDDAAALNANDYVEFIGGATLEPTAGTPLSGGTTVSVINADYQNFLYHIESYAFNVLCCPSDNDTIKAQFVAFTKRLRDEVGSKFQTVIHQAQDADYEGVVSVKNNDFPELVYWVTGALAGAAVNESLTNRRYDGEVDVDTAYTQSDLEQALREGSFVFHNVNGETRVLEDLNTLTSLTEEKGADFTNNQVVRVLDQIASDIGVLFNTKYLGKIPNDGAGRVSLWADIVKHHRALETARAIENFSPDGVTVEQGDTRKSVVVRDAITPTGTMAQLYMTVVVQ